MDTVESTEKNINIVNTPDNSNIIVNDTKCEIRDMRGKLNDETVNYNICEATIKELKTLSLIKKGNKLSVHDITFIIDDNTFFSFLTRKYHGDDRSKTLNMIKKTIYTMKEYIQLFSESIYLNKIKLSDDSNIDAIKNFDIESGKRLEKIASYMLFLHDANCGINNLLGTYNDDFAFCKEIETIHKDINKMLSEINGKLHAIYGNFIMNEEKNIKSFDFSKNFTNM